MSGTGTFDDGSGFSIVGLGGSILGNSLAQLLMADDIQPGDMPSYQTCKAIYLFHPLGAKIVEKPISKAQSKGRIIEVKDAPTERVKEEFLKQWKRDDADNIIRQTAVLSRVYGASAAALLIDGEDPSIPLDYWKLAGAQIAFNILDPLNMSGSFTTMQNPNAPDFLKYTQVRVAGTQYHPSRMAVKINEQPIYLGWTGSAFGYTGRSSYQRALYPLKSFIQTMVTDDMVAKKSGLLVAKLKQQGSIISRLAESFQAMKAAVLKLGRTNNVMTIAEDESIETLNMQNVDGAMGAARKHILENIAAAVPMPALLLNDETMGGDFHEGTEDANQIAEYVDTVRGDLAGLYDYMDRIVQHRAWTPEFYQTIRDEFPDAYLDMPYEQAFYRWRNSFNAPWEEIIKEPRSEAVKADQISLEGIFATVEKLEKYCDPDNIGKLVDWVQNSINDKELMFTVPLTLDIMDIIAFAKQKQQQLEDMQNTNNQSEDGEGDGNVLRLPNPGRRMGAGGD